jgi:O-antigen/teichoic acid export membrane protein
MQSPHAVSVWQHASVVHLGAAVTVALMGAAIGSAAGALVVAAVVAAVVVALVAWARARSSAERATANVVSVVTVDTCNVRFKPNGR